MPAFTNYAQYAKDSASRDPREVGDSTRFCTEVSLVGGVPSASQKWEVEVTTAGPGQSDRSYCELPPPRAPVVRYLWDTWPSAI